MLAKCACTSRAAATATEFWRHADLEEWMVWIGDEKRKKETAESNDSEQNRGRQKTKYHKQTAEKQDQNQGEEYQERNLGFDTMLAFETTF